MSDELKLIFVKGFTDVSRMKDAKAIHLKDESRSPQATSSYPAKPR